MEILEVITKEVFEREVPAAKMPERNTSVFSRLQGMMTEAYATVEERLLPADFGWAYEGDETLRRLCVRRVCLDAFLRTCRSLDLVLTATGFGIVSTESTAPASRARVDALIEETAVELLLCTGRMVTRLTRLSGWGETEQARRTVTTLFHTPDLLLMYTTMPLTTRTWQTASGRAQAADALLRAEISTEYMDELLHRLRTSTLNNADIIIYQKCLAFMGDYISQSPEAQPHPNRKMLRQLTEQLETYTDSYPTYRNSRLYHLRHASRYENKKQDPTFFLV